jgi:restriction system protein
MPRGRGMTLPSLIQQWYDQASDAHYVALHGSTIRSRAGTLTPSGGERNDALLDTAPSPEFMLQAAVTLGESTAEGRIVEATSIPWLAFLEYAKNHVHELHEIGWRKWEEIIAGSYQEAGYTVTLTPRSGDKGRDVVAELHGIVTVRYFEQVKAYKPGNLVTLDDVSSMLGVLAREPNVSRGIVTTTSGFAPGVLTDASITRYIPYRLDLRGRDELLAWLEQVAKGKRAT